MIKFELLGENKPFGKFVFAVYAILDTWIGLNWGKESLKAKWK